MAGRMNPNARGSAMEFMAQSGVVPKEELAPTSVEEEAPEEDEVDEDADLSPIERVRKYFPEAPSEEQLEAYKREFGEILAYVYGDEIYIMRPLRRGEHRTISLDLYKLSNSAQAEVDPLLVESAFEEQLCQRCLIYPKMGPEMRTMSRAGLMEILKKLILEISQMVPVERAMQTCTRL